MYKVYSPIDPPPKVVIKEWGKGRTRQSEAAATDINNIMKKYEKTGLLPSLDREAFFADVSTMVDYRTALHHVDKAQKAFMSLPAGVRTKFSNDPAEFLDFVSDEENRPEMVEMGLIEDVSGVVPEVVVPEVVVEEQPAVVPAVVEPSG